MALQVSAWLGISLILKSEKAAKLGEQFGQTGNSIRDISCSICWGKHMEAEQPIYYIYARGFIPSCVCSWLVTESLRVSYYLGQSTLGSSYGLPVPGEALKPFPNSSKRSPVLCPMLSCGSVHLFHSGSGWTLSGDNYTKLLSGSIRKYILSNVRNWCLPMGWVSSWAGQSLVITSFSAQSFHLHFQQTDQISSGNIFGSIGVLNSPLGVLSGCRVQPFQGPYCIMMHFC